MTLTFSGTTSVNSTGGCSSPGHNISVGEGQITVTIVEATEAAVNVQICHPTAQSHAVDCTVPPFASVSVGQSIAATLRGGRSQTVTVFPAGCGSSNAQARTVSYTLRTTFPG